MNVSRLSVLVLLVLSIYGCGDGATTNINAEEGSNVNVGSGSLDDSETSESGSDDDILNACCALIDRLQDDDCLREKLPSVDPLTCRGE